MWLIIGARRSTLFNETVEWNAKAEDRISIRDNFSIILVEFDEFNKKIFSKIGRLDQGLNPGHLHNSQAC